MLLTLLDKFGPSQSPLFKLSDEVYFIAKLIVVSIIYAAGAFFVSGYTLIVAVIDVVCLIVFETLGIGQIKVKTTVHRKPKHVRFSLTPSQEEKSSVVPATQRTQRTQRTQLAVNPTPAQVIQQTTYGRPPNVIMPHSQQQDSISECSSDTDSHGSIEIETATNMSEGVGDRSGGGGGGGRARRSIEVDTASSDSN